MSYFGSACGALYTQPVLRHLSLICRSAYAVVLIVQLISEIGREGWYVVANTALFNFPSPPPTRARMDELDRDSA